MPRHRERVGGDLGRSPGAAANEGDAMNPDDFVLVSVDDHLIEPGDAFVGRMPAKYVDDAPRIVETPGGDQAWVFAGDTIPYLGLNAVAGRPKSEYGMNPMSFDEMRAGCWDIHERVKDMSAGGVLGALCFPSFPGFAGRLFANAADKDLALAVVRAYNDWHLDAWCGEYPGRFIPMSLPVLWDAELAAQEIRRVARKGCLAVTFPENPATLGFPSIHHASWAPFWSAVSDEGIVVSIHLGSAGQLVITAEDAPVEVTMTLAPMVTCQAATDLVWSDVFRRFPSIRFALSEGGIGWIPYFLERVDRTYDLNRGWTGRDFGGRLPSEIFKEHVLTCFITDEAGLEMRHRIGIDRIAWESDYPHADSAWPYAPEELAGVLDGLTATEVEHITHKNAMDWYSFDPFAHRSRERCTVAALRAEVVGHDTSLRSMDSGRHERTPELMTMGDLAKIANF
jgi:predicted TIM-barrel fold metal-dependent hydrolase